MSDLASRRCIPCSGRTPTLTPEQQASLRRELHPDWRIVDGHHLLRCLPLPDFRAALALANRIGERAEEQGHHPDLLVSWGRLEVRVWTHAVDGLTESDFILAAQVDQLAAANAGTGQGG